MAQIDTGLSKPFRTIRYKKVIYKQQKLSRKVSPPKIFKDRPPDHIWGRFLNHSVINEPAWTARIARKPQNRIKNYLNVSKKQKSSLASKNPPSVCLKKIRYTITWGTASAHRGMHSNDDIVNVLTSASTALPLHNLC